MGKKDSSKTRVAPVFNALLAADSTGASWVNALLTLASSSGLSATVEPGLQLVAGHFPFWGDEEKRLPAPALLLEYLVTHIDLKQVNASNDLGDTRTRREALANHDAATIKEAIDALKDGKRGLNWFVLEGDSRPDALLETPTCVICIEGERTEATCTATLQAICERFNLPWPPAPDLP